MVSERDEVVFFFSSRLLSFLSNGSDVNCSVEVAAPNFVGEVVAMTGKRRKLDERKCVYSPLPLELRQKSHRENQEKRID